MTQPKSKDYVAKATQYAEAVFSGEILACEWVKKACQRQLDDVKRWKDSGPYRFDEIKANRICQFVELMPHIKGEWAKRSEKILLRPWQCFVYTTVFGWVERSSDFRRFNIVYLEMGRKNSKSTMSAPVGVYMMCADGEAGAEVYSAATKEAQAKTAVWNPAKLMVEREIGLQNRFGVKTSARSIYQPSTASYFQPISSERRKQDALNIHCAIIDELHAHHSRDLYDVLESATGSRLQPLLWLITTAGFDRSGICYEHHTYLKKILSGVAPDDHYFGVIYTLDDEDDWQDEKNWIKANPNLDISVYSKALRTEALKAARMPAALTGFLTKHMNQWVNASVNLFNVTKWNELAEPELKPEQFKLDPCWIGLDFAPRNDFSSRMQLFRRQESDGVHYYCFANHFLSEGKIEESENASYAGWAHDGWIHTNVGNQTDGREIVEDVSGLIAAGYQVEEVDCDPSRMQGIQTQIEEQTGILIVDIPQSPSNLCPATEYLSALIADGKIHHNGDPVLAWMLSNVVGVPKGNWGLYPGKERPENKIDGVSALLTALSRAMVREETGFIDYQGIESVNAF